MTVPPYLGPDELRAALSMGDAIEALDSAFSGELPTAPPRSHFDVGPGDMLVMPAWGGELGAGVKLVTATPNNPGRGLPLIHGVYVLFEPESLRVRALIDGASLTGMRTAAVSGVATRHLARPNSKELVVIGGGVQGLAHLEAMVAVLPGLNSVTCVSRTPESSMRLAKRARELGLKARTGPVEAVSESDVVCTCTTSNTPLFDGSLLSAGTHVNAVGSHKTDARELDDIAMSRAKVIVEAREPAMREAGDLRLPLESSALLSDVSELADVTTGRSPGRTRDDDITIFKSVGVAFEDLIVAVAAVS